MDLTAPHPEHVAALAQQLRLLLDEDQVNGRTTLGVAQPEGVPLGAVHARYRLQVPPDVRLRIETRDGNVHLRGFRGDAEVRTENGFIEARMDGGSVQLTTVTGRIRLNGTYADAVLSSESGSVEARIPGDQAPVSLELVSVKGAVLIDLPNARPLDLEYQGDPRLIDADMPVVVLAPRDRLYEKTVSNLMEVKARNAPVIAFVSEGERDLGSLADFVFTIPSTHALLSPILFATALQLLAYHIATLRGIDVDRPRNLAKSVTVE